MIRVLVCAIVLALPTIVFGQPRVATPTFSVGGGEYTTVIMVVVRVSTPGATIRFTQNGSDPTEFDPVIVSGSRIAINTSQTLKARAWRTGSRPSAVRAETYTMVSVAPGPPIGTGDAAAGGAQSILARPDGRVLAWKRDATPMPVDGLAGVTNVAAGTAHLLAVTLDGLVYAWGDNGFGQLGDGTHSNRRQPVRVPALTSVAAVAAGRGHSLALTDDGRVFAWGANTRGQLGIGSGKPARVPTAIPSLSDVVAIDAGLTHSVAVTRTGEVYAWGANEHGQLGDGSRKDRESPVRIPLENVIGVAAGGDHTLALGRDGAVHSWGFGARGQLGTGSTTPALRPTRVGGLLAFAVDAGRNFSVAIRNDGALVAWGANDSGQLGDGTRIDRTTPVDGPALTGISTLALGNRHAIAVTSAGDVWTWGRESSVSTTLTGVEDWGPPIGAAEELQPPTLLPPSGAYPAPQTVTLTGANTDDLLRYTLDGSDPALESLIYAAPFVVSANTTVKARAFSSVEGVEPSVIVSHTYAIDMVPPSIVAEVSPPLTPGWMTTPVTVSFRCEDDSGTVSCPGSVTVTSDGAAQLVRGTAIDPAGNQATVSVAVSVDLTAPIVTLLNAPDQTTDAQVLLSGRITDAGAGLAGDLRCNGAVVPVVQEAFECLVTLRPGVNSVTLQASDGAGHVVAAGVTVTRTGETTALTIAPDSRTMAIKEVAAISLRDEFGAAIAEATWSTSDTNVVSLSADDPPWVTALAPGTATITAEKNGLAAQATITVDDAFELAPGTPRWNIAPTAGFTMRDPIYAHRVDPTVPDMFIVETQTWGEALLRGVTSEGEVLWRQESSGIPLMGDSFGGVIAGVLYDVSQGSDFRAYVRLGSAGGVPPWRYESPGALVRPAQAEDGTIYAVEYIVGGTDASGEDIWDAHAVVLDGRNGRLIRRLPLAREVVTFTAEFDGQVISVKPRIVCASTRHEIFPETIGPIVGSDGRGYLLVRRYVKERFDSCIEQTTTEVRKVEIGVDLVMLSPGDEPTVQTIYTNRCDGPASVPILCAEPPFLHQLVPDGIGGVLVVWEPIAIVNGAPRWQTFVTRRDEDGLLLDTQVATHTTISTVGQSGIAYVAASGAYSAIDVTSWTPKWTTSLGRFGPLAAHPDGGAAVFDQWTGNYRTVNSAGEFEATALQLPMRRPLQEFDNWVGVGAAGLLSVAGQFPDASRWQPIDGNRQGQGQVRNPGIGIFLKSHWAFEGFATFKHLSIRIVPSAQAFWRKTDPSGFLPEDVYGNRFMSLGAGTGADDTHLGCSGTLTKGKNRDRDVIEKPSSLDRYPVLRSNENNVIWSLIDAFDKYANSLPYACFPESNPGYYNSNSFARGLQDVVGLPVPAPRPNLIAPGWFTPVPARYFGVGQ
jgi:hypothetical protein